MKSIRVLFVSHDSGLNGAPRSLIEMINCMKDKIEPFAIIPSNGNLVAELCKYGIPYKVVHFHNSYKRIDDMTDEQNNAYHMSVIDSAKSIASIVIENAIQIIHSNSSVIDVGAIAALMTSIPHIWHIREFMEEDFNFKYLDKEQTASLMECSAYRIAVSKSLSETFYQKYNIKSEAIYDCIDLKRYEKPFIFPKDSSKINILMAGVISNNKGQLEAIKAIRELVERNIRNILLIIVGSGYHRYLWSIERYVKNNNLQGYISILPFQSNLEDIRSKCDFSLTCSKMEALGRVTIEAMYAGLSVIGANTAGTKELIGPNNDRGFLYTQGDYLDLANTIIEAMHTPYEDLKLKNINARKFIENEMSEEMYADKILNIYQNVLTNYKKADTDEYTLRSILHRNSEYLKRINYNEKQIYKGNNGRNILSKWNKIKEQGKSIIDYFENNKYYSIAIYGFGNWGCTLYDELYNSPIKVLYMIDQDNTSIPELIKVVKPDDFIEYVDIIIIAVANDSESIKNYLKKKCNNKIKTIEEICDDLLLR